MKARARLLCAAKYIYTKPRLPQKPLSGEGVPFAQMCQLYFLQSAVRQPWESTSTADTKLFWPLFVSVWSVSQRRSFHAAAECNNCCFWLIWTARHVISMSDFCHTVEVSRSPNIIGLTMEFFCRVLDHATNLTGTYYSMVTFYVVSMLKQII